MSTSIAILILFFKLSYAGGATHIEFSDMAACEQAKAALINDKIGYNATYVAICVPKSSKKD